MIANTRAIHGPALAVLASFSQRNERLFLTLIVRLTSMATHSTVVGYLLWFFFGLIGVHRFYFGKRTTGVLWFLTGGLLGIGWLVDLFLIPRLKRQMSTRYQAGRYNYSIAWLLLVVTGVFGLHRFYAGKWGTGLLYLCTAGLVGVGVLYDFLTFNELLSETNERWISGDAELGVRS